MAQPQQDTRPASNAEKTFRSYTSEQGAAYAQGRPGYHPNLFKRIVDHHTSTGGQLDTVVDVGCGPGTATQALAAFFSTAIGLDASKGMIATARSRGGVTASGQPIQYQESTAEQLDIDSNGDTSDESTKRTQRDGTVDLITAATAAHWFDMSKFWPRAAELLKPGGTVALWTGNFHEIHSSVPNAEKMSVAMRAIEDRELTPFIEAGNLMGRYLYTTLTLPWTLDNPTNEFDEQSLYRKEWGTPTGDDSEREGQEFIINGQRVLSLELVEAALATASPVTRWREANPEKVGTKDDVVRMMTAEMARLLHEAGVPVGQEKVRGKVTGVLLMIKKKA